MRRYPSGPSELLCLERSRRFSWNSSTRSRGRRMTAPMESNAASPESLPRARSKCIFAPLAAQLAVRHQIHELDEFLLGEVGTDASDPKSNVRPHFLSPSTDSIGLRKVPMPFALCRQFSTP